MCLFHVSLRIVEQQSPEEIILGCRPIQDEVDRASDSTAMKPPIRIHPQGLAAELLQVAWFLDRFEKTMESYTSCK